MRSSATAQPSLATWRTSRFSVKCRSRGMRLRKRSSPNLAGGKMRSILSAGQNRKLVPVLLGFLVLHIIAVAQDLPTAKPESVGLSAERLERIGAAVQRNIDDKRIAGAVTMVVRHGKVAWFKAQGM